LRGDFIAIIESAYALAPTCEAWLQGVADAALPCFDQGMGVQAYAYDARDRSRFRIGACATAGHSLIDGAGIEALVRSMPPPLIDAFYKPAIAHSVVELLPRLVRPLGPEVDSSLGNALVSRNVADVLGIGAGDPSFTGCMLTFPAPRIVKIPSRLRHSMTRISAHVAAGFRLQHAAEVSPNDAAAILDPDGKLLHAASPEAKAERSSLTRFVSRRAAARGRLRREDGARAVDLWKALVEGEWTIVDHLDTDGKRLLLARRNRPAVGDPGALTLRERQVAVYAGLGHSLKFIGYELGLSPPTVSAHLKHALKKLRLRHRSELASLFRPPSN
jgi:DNA-binding CsgD family transcriptional regulator